MSGKGRLPTYWLEGVTDKVPIKKKGPDQHTKLKPFFRQPRSLQQGGGGAGGVPNTPEVKKRCSN